MQLTLLHCLSKYALKLLNVKELTNEYESDKPVYIVLFNLYFTI